MLGRNIKIDSDGNEWMNGAQYTRAVSEDFKVSLTSTLVNNFRRQEKFNSIHLKNIAGKKCINYTQTVIQFLSSHPAICPEDFATKAKEWRKKLKPKAKKTIPSNIKVPGTNKKDDKEDDYDASTSIVLEKAKHEKIKRETAQLQLDIAKAKYIQIDEVLPALQTIAIEVRQSVKAIIPRVAAIVASINDVHEIRKILDEETNVALNHTERIEQIVDGTYQQQLQEQQLKQAEDET